MDFHVGLVHYDWVLKNEMHVFNTLKNTIDAVQKKEPKKKCIMLDVGMNDGFFTNMAASMGCQVWSFELQQRCIDIAMSAIHRNHFEDRVTIANRPVSSFHNEKIMLPHNPTGCSGIFSIGRTDCPQCPKLDANHSYVQKEFTTIALHALFPPPLVIDFIKIDTEGHDPQVLEGAETLFAERRVRMLVVESMPTMWSPEEVGDTRHDDVFKRILSYGYSMGCLYTDLKFPKFTHKNKHEMLVSLHTNKCVDWKVYLDI